MRILKLVSMLLVATMSVLSMASGHICAANYGTGKLLIYGYNNFGQIDSRVQYKYKVPLRFVVVAVGDFDADGDQDFVAQDANTFILFRLTPDGSLQGKNSYSIPGTSHFIF